MALIKSAYSLRDTEERLLGHLESVISEIQDARSNNGSKDTVRFKRSRSQLQRQIDTWCRSTNDILERIDDIEKQSCSWQWFVKLVSLPLFIWCIGTFVYSRINRHMPLLLGGGTFRGGVVEVFNPIMSLVKWMMPLKLPPSAPTNVGQIAWFVSVVSGSSVFVRMLYRWVQGIRGRKQVREHIHKIRNAITSLKAIVPTLKVRDAQHQRSLKRALDFVSNLPEVHNLLLFEYVEPSHNALFE